MSIPTNWPSNTSRLLFKPVINSVVAKCVCLYCLKGAKRIIKAVVSDFWLSLLQWGGVCIMSAGPRLVLYQLDVAATPTHDLGNQDMGPGFAHSSGITQHTHTICTQEALYTVNTPTHTLWPSVRLSCPMWRKWVPQGQRETSSLKKTLFVSGFG